MSERTGYRPSAGSNRVKAERIFGIALPDYEELCLAAAEPEGLLLKEAAKEFDEGAVINGSFGAGLIVAALCAAGKKDEALKWLRTGSVR